MARKVARQQEALRRARDRQRAKDASDVTPKSDAVRMAAQDPRLTDGARRRLATTSCAWCNEPIDVKARGRVPKWCSSACRQRAWEQKRAAASGRDAVEVVERRIEVPVPETPRQGQWVLMLEQLAVQIAHGRLYERHLDEVAVALDEAVRTMRHRRAHPMR